MGDRAVQGWRIFETASTGDSVLVGLERVSERRRLLFASETRVEERILSREFGSREIVAIAGYRGLLEEVAHYLAGNTYGSFVTLDPLSEGIRVRLCRRLLNTADGSVDVEIASEKQFPSDAIADSAACAEELRAQAHQENESLWQGMRDAEARGESERAAANEKAREAAELAAILRDEQRDGAD